MPAGREKVLPEKRGSFWNGLPCAPAVVVEEVLVEELPVAVRARAGDEDRRRLPDARVLQLRGVRQRLVEDVRTGPRSRTRVQRAGVCARRGWRDQQGGACGHEYAQMPGDVQM